MDDTSEPAASRPGSRPATAWEGGFRYIALVVLLVLAAVALRFVAPIADIILVALLASFLLFTPCRVLASRTRLGFGASVALVYVVAFALLTWLLWQGAQALAPALQELGQHLGAAAAQLAAGEGGTAPLRPLDVLQQASTYAGEAASRLTLGLKSVLGLIGLVFTGLFLSLFIQLNMGAAQGQLRQRVPAPYHREVAVLLRTLDRVWIGYVTAMLIYAGLLTVGAFVIFVLVGAPLPGALAVFNGLMNLIPTVGGIIAMVVTAVICAATGSSRLDMPPGMFGLLMAAIMFLLVQVTYNFIALPIISRSVKLPAAVVLVAVLAALAYGSPLLAFLVPPLVSTLRLVGAYVLDKVRQLEPMSEEAMPESAVPGFFSQLYFPVQRTAEK